MDPINVIHSNNILSTQTNMHKFKNYLHGKKHISYYVSTTYYLNTFQKIVIY